MAVTILKGYQATITSPITAAKWTSVDEVTSTREIDDITGIAVGTEDGQPEFAQHFPVKDYVLTGAIKHSSSTATGNAKTLAVSTLTGLTVKPYDWVLRRHWPLTNVTGQGDPTSDSATAAALSWAWSVPITTLTMRTWVKSGGPDWDGDNLTITLSMDIFGTLAYNGTSGKGIVTKQTAGFKTKDGFIGMSYQILLSGYATYSKGTADFDNVFSDTDGTTKEPPRDTTALAVTSGDTITGTAIVHDVSIYGSKSRGGAVFVTAKHRFDVA